MRTSVAPVTREEIDDALSAFLKQGGQITKVKARFELSESERSEGSVTSDDAAASKE